MIASSILNFDERVIMKTYFLALFLIAGLSLSPSRGHPEVNPLSKLKHNKVVVEIGELV